MVNENALILSRPLEDKLIAICDAEHLIDLSDRFWQYKRERITGQTINADDRSHIFANIFLRPVIKFAPEYETPVSFKTNLITKSMDWQPQNEMEFEDFPLFLSYCKAMNSQFDADRVANLVMNFEVARGAVSQVWGDVPSVDGNGQPMLLSDFIASTISRGPRPTYSHHHHTVYHAYRNAREAASVVIQCFQDLNSVWRRKRRSDAVGIHPKLHLSYREILDSKDFEADLSEKDIFFLSVRALRTLPVGRSLTETLELAATPEGKALRQRVSELNAELLAGGQAGIPKILAKIENDAEQYRILTNRLSSPHTMDSATDVVLGTAGLIPVLGTIFSILGLMKSSYKTWASREDSKRLKQMLWASYQGRSI